MVAASDHEFLLMDNTYCTYLPTYLPTCTGYSVDVTYTSRLKRAIRSAWVLLMCLNEVYKPVYKVSWWVIELIVAVADVCMHVLCGDIRLSIYLDAMHLSWIFI